MSRGFMAAWAAVAAMTAFAWFAGGPDAGWAVLIMGTVPILARMED